MDPFTLTSSVLASVKGASDIAKSILSLKSATDNVELKEHLVNLREALVDAKDMIIEVREALQEKDAKIKELETRLKKDEELSFNKEYGCYETEKDGELIRYCLNCHADKGLYITLQDDGNSFYCNHCEREYRNIQKSTLGISGCAGENIGNPFSDL